MNKTKKNYGIDINVYPGLLLGCRTYKVPKYTSLCLYVPFIYISFSIEEV